MNNFLLECEQKHDYFKRYFCENRRHFIFQTQDNQRDHIYLLPDADYCRKYVTYYDRDKNEYTFTQPDEDKKQNFDIIVIIEKFVFHDRNTNSMSNVIHENMSDNDLKYLTERIIYQNGVIHGIYERFHKKRTISKSFYLNNVCLINYYV